MKDIDRTEFIRLYRDFMSVEGRLLSADTISQLKQDIRRLSKPDKVLAEMVKSMHIAMISHREISLGHHSVEAILLYAAIYDSKTPISYVEKHYDNTTARIVDGLSKVYDLYNRHVAVETENFRKLLLSFAEDVRVIMIMIAERLDTMRHLQEYEKEEQEEIAREVSYLYAPLAHRMGLYGIKTELEDLSLKYTSYDIYKDIAKKLNETKRSRDAYIKKFIEPVKTRLEEAGLKFEIKGRTKSIYSIWNKLRKQQVPFEKVYDLFAIRVIIDCPKDKEKSSCWQAFSVVTDMYTPNINRLRDWISVPKSNGYESLHITVMGPEGKWVEVQIRTQRMDEVAEKGMAAHWKYKGGKSDSASTDQWLKNLRDMLEHSSDSSDQMEVIDEFKMQLYDDDVFVFTPKGDLHQLHKGSTVLDFAFGIHTKIGAQCMGAIINGKHVSFKYELQNGDQVEVLTSPTQQPRADWLNWAHTSKARYRIKQALKEEEHREADLGREILLRRLKNWKLEFEDSAINKSARKMGYKSLSEFYVAINQDKINLQQLHEWLEYGFETPDKSETASRTAEGFLQETELEKISSQDDALIIDKNLKNVDYSLARCCNPVYGDDIFGFVSVSGGIKIHRKDCPNAPQLISRYGYRIVNAKWAGNASGTEYTATIRVVGHDDIGIVTNITSIISKETGVSLRSIMVNSHDGLFDGTMTLMIHESSQLVALFKKIKAVKGVKQIFRV